DVGPALVLNTHIERGILGAGEGRDLLLLRPRRALFEDPILPIDAQALALAQGGVPEKTARRLVRLSFVRRLRPAVGVARRCRLLPVIGHVSRHGPGMALVAHFGVGEKAIEQAEPLGERVMVRRYLPGKELERRIAISLREVA